MKLSYKKVGETLSLDEYNAICYILEQQGWVETITLQKDDYYEGKFGKYRIYDPNEVLVENSNGFTFLRDDLPFYIQYESIFNCQYKIMFNVENSVTKNVTVYSGENKGAVIPTVMYPNEKFDSLDETDDLTQPPIDKVTEKVNQPITRYYDKVDPFLDNQSVIIQNHINTLREQEYIGSDGLIKIIPSKYNYKKGYFIHARATIQLDYSEPELNITDGNYDKPNEILCSNFKELKTVIETAPPKSVTHIRLTGTKFIFTDQIYIADKTVHIRGGNVNYNDIPYTVLDAQYNCRHFYIDSRSNVTIEDCYICNGNAYGNNSRSYLHHRGGSIYVGSLYELYGGDYVHLKTIFTAKNCRFIRNIAEFGGAIFNHNSRVELDSCMFYQNMCMYEKYHDPDSFNNCDFDYKLWNWGGAIRSESVTGYKYKESYDRLHIVPSRYSVRKIPTSKSVSFTTYIDLEFNTVQNTTFLMSTKLTTKNFKLIDITNKKHIEYPLYSINKKDTTHYKISIHKKIPYDHIFVFYYTGDGHHYDMLSKRLITTFIVKTETNPTVIPRILDNATTHTTVKTIDDNHEIKTTVTTQSAYGVTHTITKIVETKTETTNGKTNTTTTTNTTVQTSKLVFKEV